ncbi:tetratricopeptide repeat protein [bacterium]|nr:tetratricopeptide repeat protein [bacterium]
MGSPQDAKLAALVIRDRLLSQEQLSECLAIQRRLEEKRTLAQVIVARHYLSADQLRDLVASEVARRSGKLSRQVRVEDDPDDMAFGRELVARGIVDESRLYECLALTRMVRETRPHVRLVQVVLKKGYATRETLASVLAAVESAQSGRDAGPPPARPRVELGPMDSWKLPPSALVRGAAAPPVPAPPSSPPVPPEAPAPPSSAPRLKLATARVKPKASALFPTPEVRDAGAPPAPSSPPVPPAPPFPPPEPRAVSGARSAERKPSARDVATTYSGRDASAREEPGQPPGLRPTDRLERRNLDDAPADEASPLFGDAVASKKPLFDLESFGRPVAPLEEKRHETFELSKEEKDRLGVGAPRRETSELSPTEKGRLGMGVPRRETFELDPTEKAKLGIGEPLARKPAPFEVEGRHKTVDLVDEEGGVPFEVEARHKTDDLHADAAASERPPDFTPPREPRALGDETSKVPFEIEARYKTFELPPGDPGIPEVKKAAPLPDVAGDPFGEGRGSAAGFDAFESTNKKPKGPPRVATPPDGFPVPSRARASEPRETVAPEKAPAPGSARGALREAEFGGGAFGSSKKARAAAPFAFPEGGVDLIADPPSEEPRPFAIDMAPSDSEDPLAVANVARDATRKDRTGTRREPRDRGEKTEARAEKTPSSSGKKVLGVALAVLVLLGIGATVVLLVTRSSALEEKEKQFLGQVSSRGPDRNVAALLKLAKDLPGSVQKKPEVALAIKGLEEEAHALEVRERAEKALAATPDDSPPDERLKACQEAVAADKTFARGWLELARARIRVGRHAQKPAALADARQAAIEDLNRALSADAKLLDAYWELANVKEELPGALAREAGRHLDSIRQLDPNGWMGFLAEARLRFAERDLKAAGELFKKASDMKADAALPHLARSRFLLLTNAGTNDRAAGRVEAEKALAIAKTSPEALVLRAWARRLLTKDLMGAKADLRQALVIDSDWAPAYGQLALIEFEEGARVQAQADAERALAIDDREPMALLARANVENALGKTDEARKTLEVALDRDDKLVPALLLHGQLALQKSDYKAARVDFRKILEIEPQNARAIANRAVILMSEKQFEEARRELNRALDLDPNYDRALVARARASIEGEPHEYESAIRDLNKGLQLTSDMPDAYYFRGVAHYETGKLQDAVNDLTTALQKPDPSWQYVALYVRGMAHFFQKDWAEAIKDFDEADKLSDAGWIALQKCRAKRAEAVQRLAEEQKK